MAGRLLFLYALHYSLFFEEQIRWIISPSLAAFVPCPFLQARRVTLSLNNRVVLPAFLHKVQTPFEYQPRLLYWRLNSWLVKSALQHLVTKSTILASQIKSLLLDTLRFRLHAIECITLPLKQFHHSIQLSPWVQKDSCVLLFVFLVRGQKEWLSLLATAVVFGSLRWVHILMRQSKRTIVSPPFDCYSATPKKSQKIKHVCSVSNKASNAPLTTEITISLPSKRPNEIHLDPKHPSQTCSKSIQLQTNLKFNIETAA